MRVAAMRFVNRIVASFSFNELGGSEAFQAVELLGSRPLSSLQIALAGKLVDDVLVFARLPADPLTLGGCGACKRIQELVARVRLRGSSQSCDAGKLAHVAHAVDIDKVALPEKGGGCAPWCPNCAWIPTLPTPSLI